MFKNQPLIVAGILTALAVGGFYIFLYPHFSELPGLFYTNMAAIVLAIWMTWTNVFDFNMFQGIKESDETAASRGFMWYTGMMYHLSVLAVVIFSFIYEWPMQYVIFAHVAIIGLLVISNFTANAVSRSVARAEGEHQRRAASMESVKSDMQALVVELEMANLPMERVKEIKESLRYITPSDNPEALKLENKLRTEFIALAGKSGLTPQELDEHLDRCKKLITLRKQIY